LHFGFPGLLRSYIHWGGGRVTEQTLGSSDRQYKGQQRPQRAAWRAQTAREEKKNSAEERRSLGAGHRGGCGNSARGGFAAQPGEAKPSPTWRWPQSRAVWERVHGASGSPLQPASL